MPTAATNATETTTITAISTAVIIPLLLALLSAEEGAYIELPQISEDYKRRYRGGDGEPDKYRPPPAADGVDYRADCVRGDYPE